MKKFEVWVTEITDYRVEVEAKNSEDALRLAEEDVANGASESVKGIEIAADAKSVKEIDND